MIRFRNYVFDDYFINPITAEITDADGNVKNQTKWGRYKAVCIHAIAMDVHCVQAHTAYGYKKGYDVHHKDDNPLNNALSNLEYRKHGEHSSITNKGRKYSEERNKHLSEITTGRKRTKESNNKLAEYRSKLFGWTDGVNNMFSMTCPR